MTRVPPLDTLAQDVRERAGENAAARLQAAIETGRELTDAGDALVERFVAEARGAGLSWSQIGESFGTSKQAAQKRYGATSPPGAWPGDRLAEPARQVLIRALEEARSLGHSYVGTEHVLLTLTDPGAGIAAHALADLGVSRADVLAELPPACHPRRESLGMMPRLKRALELAAQQAEQLGHGRANTEHLLSAIVAIPDALATCILRERGISRDDVLAALGIRLGVPPTQLALPRQRRRLRRFAA